MADNEAKAVQLMADAEKKLTTQKGFFGSLFGCVFSNTISTKCGKKSIVCVSLFACIIFIYNFFSSWKLIGAKVLCVLVFVWIFFFIRF